MLRFFIHLEMRELEDAFPADFIAEGIDQTRGWYIWYTPSHVFVDFILLSKCLTEYLLGSLLGAGVVENKTDSVPPFCSSHPAWTQTCLSDVSFSRYK